jgi:hypothetical protein
MFKIQHSHRRFAAFAALLLLVALLIIGAAPTTSDQKDGGGMGGGRSTFPMRCWSSFGQTPRPRSDLMRSVAPASFP